MDLNALQVPILGLDGQSSSVVIPDYGAPLGIPVPDDALEHLIITSTDSQGNCYVTLQESYVSPKTDSTQDVQVVSRVTRLPQNNFRNAGRRNMPGFCRTRMIADHVTTISTSEFKAQLKDTSDIIGRYDLAPTTKAAMSLLKSKGVAKTFSTPGRKFTSAKLVKMFHRHLTTSITDAEEKFNDMILLPVGYQREIDPTKIKRITRRRRYPEAEEYHRKLMEAKMQESFNKLVAQSQKNMETVFVECSAVLGSEQNSVEILVETGESNTLSNEELQAIHDGSIISNEAFEAIASGNIKTEVPQITIKDEELQNGFTVETPETNFETLQTSGDLMNEGSQRDVDVFHSEEVIESFQPDNIDDSLIVIQNEEGTVEGAENGCSTQQNLEVLLAAAAESGIDRDSIHEVIICDPSNSEFISLFSDTSSIIIVPSDSLADTVTETVITS